eukprot:GHVT01099110.1.p1 GENE.GHVT01099110.1~~GHVT01099110.1.p1  ORF type:complete len:308 (+),score=22.26 GHVT01099110.1:654-1577(+)
MPPRAKFQPITHHVMKPLHLQLKSAAGSIPQRHIDCTFQNIERTGSRAFRWLTGRRNPSANPLWGTGRPKPLAPCLFRGNFLSSRLRTSRQRPRAEPARVPPQSFTPNRLLNTWNSKYANTLYSAESHTNARSTASLPCSSYSIAATSNMLGATFCVLRTTALKFAPSHSRPEPCGVPQPTRRRPHADVNFEDELLVPANYSGTFSGFISTADAFPATARISNVAPGVVSRNSFPAPFVRAATRGHGSGVLVRLSAPLLSDRQRRIYNGSVYLRVRTGHASKIRIGKKSPCGHRRRRIKWKTAWKAR